MKQPISNAVAAVTDPLAVCCLANELTTQTITINRNILTVWNNASQQSNLF